MAEPGPCVLAIDLGTSGPKAAVANMMLWLDRRGAPRAVRDIAGCPAPAD